MRSQRLIVALFYLVSPVVIAGKNICAVTSDSNCYDNVGQPCIGTKDPSGSPVSQNEAICCYESTDGSQSGYVHCDFYTGLWADAPCAIGQTCQTSFDTCQHDCVPNGVNGIA